MLSTEIDYKMKELKEFKMIYIHNCGDHSVKGTIFEKHGESFLNDLNNYTWLIGVYDRDDFSMVENECKDMKIEEYLIFDFRQSKRSSEIGLW